MSGGLERRCGGAGDDTPAGTFAPLPPKGPPPNSKCFVRLQIQGGTLQRQPHVLHAHIAPSLNPGAATLPPKTAAFSCSDPPAPVRADPTPQQVTISCLINLISDLPPEQRAIPLSTIADKTKLSVGALRACMLLAPRHCSLHSSYLWPWPPASPANGRPFATSPTLRVLFLRLLSPPLMFVILKIWDACNACPHAIHTVSTNQTVSSSF
jgi:hypothetical protein